MDTLRSVLMSLAGLRNASDIGLLHEYMMWAADAQRMLLGIIRADDVEAAIVTSRYLAVGAIVVPAAANIMIRDEIERLQLVLARFVDELNEQRKRWHVTAALAVPDTNFFVHHPQDLMTVGWRHELGLDIDWDSHMLVRLIVPMIVIDELDRLKDRGQGPAKTRARHTLRKIDELTKGGKPTRPVTIRQRDQTGGAVTLEVFIDDLAHERLPHADSELIDRVLHIEQVSSQKVTILTGDTGMALRARAAGVQVVKVDMP